MSETLKQIIAETQATFRGDPDKAKVTFSSQSQLQDGFHSKIAIREHTLSADEPPELGGTDKGPNPVELILAALGSCQEITYRAYASALGIPLESVSVKLVGDIDLRGFFAVSDDVRAGYQAIRGTVELTSSASEEQLQTLREIVDSHCPVLDILSNPVPVDLELRVTETVTN